MMLVRFYDVNTSDMNWTLCKVKGRSEQIGAGWRNEEVDVDAEEG